MLKSIYAAIVCVGALILTGASPSNNEYAEGQVWQYKTRPGDEGSLLKIQKIERPEEYEQTGTVYHVSIIGVHFSGLTLGEQIQHAPFSKDALDASLTRLSRSRAKFPDPSEGIAQWRTAHGGVFTVSVADAVGFVAQTIRGANPAPSSQPETSINFSRSSEWRFAKLSDKKS